MKKNVFFAHRDNATTVDGRPSQPSAEKVPDEELAAKCGALKYTKTRMVHSKYLVLVHQVPGSM